MTEYLKIYGERNTNTNYMSQLVKLNLAVTEVPGVVPPSIMKIQNTFPGNELVRGIYFSLTYARNLGWKHACVKTPDQLKNYKLANSDLAFITITKNPYSWLLSLYRRPYHQYYTDSPSFEAFLGRPWKTIARDNIKGRLANPIELWNIKNRSYLDLARKNTMNITSEALLECPESIIREIGDRFSIEKASSYFINIETSTKESGKDYAYYRDYYLSERWKEQLSNEAIQIINAALDRQTMSDFGYRLLPG